MNNRAKAFIMVAAIAGLVTGCASAPKKECKGCHVSGKSDKVSCGTKASCTSKSACSGKGNCGTKGS